MKRIHSWTAALLVALVVCSAGASTGQFRLDIPGGALPTSLERLAGTIGGDVIFDHTARGVQTRPVRGEMSVESALDQMLLGTGLSYRYNPAARRIVISRNR